MSTRALNILIDDQMSVVERARALRVVLNESHRMAEGDIGYHLGRRFWNRRAHDGKFTNGVGIEPARGVTVGRKDLPGEIPMSGVRGPSALVPTPDMKITVPKDRSARLSALEHDLTAATSDVEREGIKGKILDVWNGQTPNESAPMHPAAQKVMWAMYERARAGERRAERDRAANEPLAIKDRGGIASRTAGDLEAQLSGMAPDDPERVSVERELAKQQRIARRAENRLAVPEETPQAPASNVASRNESIQQEIAVLDGRIAKYEGWIEKNDQAIADLDPADEAYAEKKTSLENTNKRHTSRIKNTTAEREKVSLGVIDVEGGAAASSMPRELSPEARERASQRRINTALARVTGSAPFQDERGTLISRAAPDPTGVEMDAARQAASTKAAQFRREGAPSTIGSGRNTTVMSKVGGSAQREQQTRDRMSEVAQIMVRKEAVLAAWRDLRPDYEDPYREAKARLDLAEQTENEELIAKAEDDLQVVVGDFIYALNEKVAESSRGGLGLDPDKLDAYADGSRDGGIKIMTDPFGLEPETPWAKAGWKIFRAKELEDPLSPDELIVRNAATGSAWANHPDAPEGSQLVPTKWADAGITDRELLKTHRDLSSRLGDWFIDTPVREHVRSWKDALTRGRPATPRERVEALTNHVDIEFQSALRRREAAEKDLSRRIELTIQITNRLKRVESNPAKYDNQTYAAGTRKKITERDAIPKWSADDMLVRERFVFALRDALLAAIDITSRDDAALADGSGRDAIEKAFAGSLNSFVEGIDGINTVSSNPARHWAKDSRASFGRVDRGITEFTTPEDKGKPEGLATQPILQTNFERSVIPGGPRSKGTMTINQGPSRALATFKKLMTIGRELQVDSPPERSRAEQADVEREVRRRVADGVNADGAREQAVMKIERRRVHGLQKKQETLARELADENVEKAFDLRRMVRSMKENLNEQSNDPSLPRDQREKLHADYAANDSVLIALDAALRGAGHRIYKSTADATDALEQEKGARQGIEVTILLLKQKKNPNLPEIARQTELLKSKVLSVRAIEEDLNLATAMEAPKAPKRESGEAVLRRRGDKFDTWQYARPIEQHLLDKGVPPLEAKKLAGRAAKKLLAADNAEGLASLVLVPQARKDLPAPEMPAGQLSLDRAIARSVTDFPPAPTESTVPLDSAVQSITDVTAARIRSLRLGARPVSERLAMRLVAAEVARRVESGEIKRETVTKMMTSESFPRTTRTIRPAYPDKGIMDALVATRVSGVPERVSTEVQVERYLPISAAQQDAILLAVIARVDKLNARRR